MAATPAILFVDAYDSFTQNIIAVLHHELKTDVTTINIHTDVVQEFGYTLDGFVQQFAAVVLGPGPGDPRSADDIGNFDVILDAAAAHRVPVLGICLGFQRVCGKYGMSIQRMPLPCHGQVKQIFAVDLDPSGPYSYANIFSNLMDVAMHATCYNSLGVTLEDNTNPVISARPGSSSTNTSFSSFNSQHPILELASQYADAGKPLKVLAVDSDGNIMAVGHRYLPVWGVQFHPESCMSNEVCIQLMQNWLAVVLYNNSQVRQNYAEELSNLFRTSHKHSANDDTAANPLDTSVRQQKWSAADVYKGLAHAGRESGNKVQYEKLSLPCDREEVSDLVNRLCPPGYKLMLESTKKGRFSIYAIFLRETTGSLKPISSTATYATPPHLHYRRPIVRLAGSDELGRPVSIAGSTSRENVMAGLESFMISKKATGGAAEIPFWGGFSGYMAYESGLDGLDIGAFDNEKKVVDDISLVWVERSLVFDAQTKVLYVQSIRRDDRDFVRDMADMFLRVYTHYPLVTPLDLADEAESNAQKKLDHILRSKRIYRPSQAAYAKLFDQCQEELRRGNSYELCLTTENHVELSIPQNSMNFYEFELYKSLHDHNPVPFGAFIDFPEVTILSSSPEEYMSWSRFGTIDMVPMKGTVKRSPDMSLERATEILSSRKEFAENLMIADLIRHDLYTTVGYQAKVEVIKLCQVVQHSTVYQLVSHIRAHPPINHLPLEDRQEKAIHYGFRALRTTLPPGSMTGAPKKRSCEILSRLEARNRGLYSGVIGYLDVGGGGCWSVCIRTAYRVRHTDIKLPKFPADITTIHKWRIGAGGAITVLSDKQGEYDEMNVKFESVMKGFTPREESDGTDSDD